MEAKSDASCDTVQGRIFGAVPSESEAKSALTELHNYTTGISSPATILDRFQHMLLSYHPTVVQSDGYRKVRTALSFLHTDSSFQRVVVSLSCDKALWNAVMNNKEVVEMKERLLPVRVLYMSMPKSCMEEPDLALRILKWILELTKTKILELIESFKSLVNAVFQAHHGSDLSANALMEDKIGSSILLCIVNLLVIILARAQLIYSSVAEPVGRIQPEPAISREPGSYFFLANCASLEVDKHVVRCKTVVDGVKTLEPWSFDVA